MTEQHRPVQPVTVPTDNSVPPVRAHWFYKRSGEDHWTPFSCVDSGRLEQQFLTPHDQQQKEVIIPTDGGRYDVNFRQRIRQAIYWDEEPCPVRRCTWFYRTEADRWLQPYEESISKLLEVSYPLTHTPEKTSNYRIFNMHIYTILLEGGCTIRNEVAKFSGWLPTNCVT